MAHLHGVLQRLERRIVKKPWHHHAQAVRTARQVLPWDVPLSRTMVIIPSRPFGYDQV